MPSRVSARAVPRPPFQPVVCRCIGGLYDQTCRVHGNLAPVPRNEHDFIVSDLLNRIEQLKKRMREAESDIRRIERRTSGMDRC